MLIAIVKELSEVLHHDISTVVIPSASTSSSELVSTPMRRSGDIVGLCVGWGSGEYLVSSASGTRSDH